MTINFVTIHVADIERSIKFYNRVLGMQVSRRFSPRPGMEIAFMGGSGVQVEFIHDDQVPPYKGTGISLGFYVADMEQTLALLKENQVEIVSGPLPDEKRRQAPERPRLQRRGARLRAAALTRQ